MNYLIKRGVSRNFKFQELTNAMRIRKFNEMCNLSYYSILQQFLNLSQSTENWFVLRVLTVLKLIWISNSWSVSLYCIESIKYCFLYMHSDDVILLIVWKKIVYTFKPGATFLYYGALTITFGRGTVQVNLKYIFLKEVLV